METARPSPSAGARCMRRAVFLTLGLLEFVVAGMLVTLGLQLPSRAAVGDSFRHAERVTDRAGSQVRLLHRQVTGLRRLELQQLAERLRKQSKLVTQTLRNRSIDYDTVQAMRDALGEVSKGLGGVADTLDPASLGRLSAGLGETADYLDGRVVPTAQKAAEHLEESTAALRRDAQRLAALLKAAPPDLQAMREVHTSLGKFREGIDRMNAGLKLQRIDTVRDGFQGLETSLSTGAEQVERLSRYSYPAMTVNGLKVNVTQRQFWPEGDKIAEGMRKAANGVTAAQKEVDDWAADVPRLRESLAESGKMIDRLREALGVALAQQDKLEPVLKDAPANAARMAEELPKLGGDLALILRDTRRLKEVAAALRQAQKGLDDAAARWPETRRTLRQLATVLGSTRDQLDEALQHRAEYEAALQQTTQVADLLAVTLPTFTEQLDATLDEEEQALQDLSRSLEEARDALPVYERTASNVTQTGRLLAWLVAAVVALHGLYLVLSDRLGTRFSA
jgi:ABC-type transporter Mla subunit MlaD